MQAAGLLPGSGAPASETFLGCSSPQKQRPSVVPEGEGLVARQSPGTSRSTSIITTSSLFVQSPSANSRSSGAGSQHPSILRCRASSGTSTVGTVDAVTSSAPRRDGSQLVLLLDVMDTLVADPFHWHIPNFFGMSMKELLAEKHPTAWVDFEKGLISEKELHSIFFNDRRYFDIHGLKAVMRDAYKWVEGMEEVLQLLKAHNVEMHAFTNYPEWYSMIEDKLQISRYVQWTFVSCHTGLRKPEVTAYEKAAAHLGLNPQQCVFVDDRKSNVQAAESVGMKGLHFSSASELSQELASLFTLPK